MSFTIRINTTIDGMTSAPLMDIAELTRQMNIKNTDPAIRRGNFENWIAKQNGNEQKFKNIPITNGTTLVVPEGVQGNTILFDATGNFASLLTACPELADYNISIDLTAQLRINKKPPVIEPIE